MIITENFYLKLFPASFIKQTGTVGKEQFELKMDLYSKNEDMEKNGWKKFLTMDEMNKAADIKNQPPGVKDLLIKSIYSIGNN
jgi:hypothetical protein